MRRLAAAAVHSVGLCACTARRVRPPRARSAHTHAQFAARLGSDRRTGSVGVICAHLCRAGASRAPVQLRSGARAPKAPSRPQARRAAARVAAGPLCRLAPLRSAAFATIPAPLAARSRRAVLCATAAARIAMPSRKRRAERAAALRSAGRHAGPIHRRSCHSRCCPSVVSRWCAPKPVTRMLRAQAAMRRAAAPRTPPCTI